MVTDKETLENTVNKMGIKTVIRTLEDICHEKAEHMRTNWQDDNLAYIWGNIGCRLNKIDTLCSLERL